ncbi:twitching motility protein PilT [Spirochaetia bacterium]|nr:twitching motility protein PilT [Spirochaetia bacterium]
MNVLLDTNIALDVILRREPFYQNANKIVKDSRDGMYTAFVSASAVTDISYIAGRELRDKTLVMSRLKLLLETVDIAAVTGVEIRRAIDLDWNDFEDCVQFTAGERLAVRYIITRDAGEQKAIRKTVLPLEARSSFKFAYFEPLYS